MAECEHGITLEGIVERCAECGEVVSRRPSEEAALRARLAECEDMNGYLHTRPFFRDVEALEAEVARLRPVHESGRSSEAELEARAERAEAALREVIEKSVQGYLVTLCQAALALTEEPEHG